LLTISNEHLSGVVKSKELEVSLYGPAAWLEGKEREGKKEEEGEGKGRGRKEGKGNEKKKRER
jgi:hypothetical protein